jgi:hypothetical protein
VSAHSCAMSGPWRRIRGPDGAGEQVPSATALFKLIKFPASSDPRSVGLATLLAREKGIHDVSCVNIRWLVRSTAARAPSVRKSLRCHVVYSVL